MPDVRRNKGSYPEIGKRQRVRRKLPLPKPQTPLLTVKMATHMASTMNHVDDLILSSTGALAASLFSGFDAGLMGDIITNGRIDERCNSCGLKSCIERC